MIQGYNELVDVASTEDSFMNLSTDPSSASESQEDDIYDLLRMLPDGEGGDSNVQIIKDKYEKLTSSGEGGSPPPVVEVHVSPPERIESPPPEPAKVAPLMFMPPSPPLSPSSQRPPISPRPPSSTSRNSSPSPTSEPAPRPCHFATETENQTGMELARRHYPVAFNRISSSSSREYSNEVSPNRSRVTSTSPLAARWSPPREPSPVTSSGRYSADYTARVSYVTARERQERVRNRMRERGMRMASPDRGHASKRNDISNDIPEAVHTTGVTVRAKSPMKETVRVNGSVPTAVAKKSSAAIPTSAITRSTHRAPSRASSRGRSISPAARSASYRKVIQETKERQSALRPKKAWGPPPGTKELPTRRRKPSVTVTKTTKELTRFTERTLSEAVRRGKLDAVTELAEFIEEFNRKIQGVLDGDRPSPVPSPRRERQPSRSRPVNRPISGENSIPLPAAVRPPSRNPSPTLSRQPSKKRNPSVTRVSRSSKTNSSKADTQNERPQNIHCNKEAAKERPNWNDTVKQANNYLKTRRSEREARKKAVQQKARTWFE
eukprot:TRINITY_DN1775_c2_g1_i1.p1 TRINITY_DN1775_c2_g1~~TRINITY_DN1775_c2_g1_i1.p1  ORF type:complete len:551 (+),score=84.28 TRINITY_DN1775_c2_g1_i1:78-1730(+)